MTDLEQFLDNVAAFLEYQKEEGFQTLEISAETKAMLTPVKTAAAQPASKPAAARPRPALAPEPAPEPMQMPGDDIRVTGKTLEEIAKQISTCTGCPLHASRNKTVPGEGNSERPDILFIGEAPSSDEDAQGKPFVGTTGQLLTKMIGAMGYTRDQIFITHTVKCRPPGTRVPLPNELGACNPYLRKQIELIQPKVIVAMGKTAVEGLLKKPVALTRFRGTWCKYEGIDLMPTFDPAYLERVPAKKREAWADLQAVMAKLGKNPTK
jgi:DNA polymerase